MVSGKKRQVIFKTLADFVSAATPVLKDIISARAAAVAVTTTTGATAAVAGASVALPVSVGALAAFFILRILQGRSEAHNEAKNQRTLDLIFREQESLWKQLDSNETSQFHHEFEARIDHDKVVGLIQELSDCQKLGQAELVNCLERHQLVTEGILKCLDGQPDTLDEILHGVQKQAAESEQFRDQLRRSLCISQFNPRIKPLRPIVRSGSFQSYLKTIPYYSRSEHMEHTPFTGSGILHNEAQIAELITCGREPALMVTGAGGMGKTRTVLEIAEICWKEGWTVGRVDEGATHEELDLQLRGMSIEDNGPGVLLVLDYVELMPHFHEIHDWVTTISDETAIKVRYIANCRKHYFTQTLRGTFENARIIEITPSTLNRDEHDWLLEYRRQTVKHILKHFSINPEGEAFDVCRDRPVLAALLGYLIEQDPVMTAKADIADLLSGLTQDRQFGEWLQRRMRVNLRDAYDPKQVAQIMMCLPASRESYDCLRQNEAKQTVEVLSDDQWILCDHEAEKIGELPWRSVHDVIPDELLLAQCRATGDIETLLRDLVKGAVDAGCLRSALIALQRISGEKGLEDFEWYSLLMRISLSCVQDWKDVRIHLFQSALFSATDRLCWLRDVHDLWIGAETEGLFQLHLGLTAKAIVKADSSLPDDLFPVLQCWLEKCANTMTNKFLLNWGLQAVPNSETLQRQVLECIREPGIPNWHSRSLIAAWLAGTGKNTAVKPDIRCWLDAHGTESESDFVLKAWLIHSDDPQWVRDDVRCWLDAHGTESEANFVLNAWLTNSGDPQWARDYVRRWLDANATEPVASHVLNAWLTNSGDPQCVRDDVRRWLDANATEPGASHVLAEWVTHSGDPQCVRDDVRRWLDAHSDESEANFVLNAWLTNSGDPQWARDYVRRWLDANGTESEANFVLAAWLTNSGDPQWARDYVRRWLDANGTEPVADYVLAAWVTHSGDPQCVRDDVRRWLDAHGTEPVADYVLKAWLKHSGDPQWIREAVRRWLDAHRSEPEADYVLKLWLKCSKDPQWVKEAVRRWLNAHSSEPDADYVINAWLKHSGDPQWIREDVRRWLKANGTELGAGYVVSNWMLFTSDFKMVEQATMRWLDLWGSEKRAVYVLHTWLRSDDGRLEYNLKQVCIRWFRSNRRKDPWIARQFALFLLCCTGKSHPRWQKKKDKAPLACKGCPRLSQSGIVPSTQP